ncbi:MAG: hypothetical protein MJ090_05755 [Clostridia bacterium]|nr:hypothetical protein [Clostridia bacterium]
MKNKIIYVIINIVARKGTKPQEGYQNNSTKNIEIRKTKKHKLRGVAQRVAPVLGERESASGGRRNERSEAPRSKVVRAPSEKQLLGTARGLLKQ